MVSGPLFETPETLPRLFRTLFGPRGRKAPGDSFGDSSKIPGPKGQGDSSKGRAVSQACHSKPRKTRATIRSHDFLSPSKKQNQKAADVWKKDVWDFQAFSQTSLELRFSLGNEGKDRKNLNSQTWPGTPRRPSSRHPRPSNSETPTQYSATPASVAATPPCSATPFQRQLDVRHSWPFKGDRCDRAFLGLGCSAILLLHLKSPRILRKFAATRVARHV